jgi:DNA primase
LSLESERLAFEHALELCRTHRTALADALADLAQRPAEALDLATLSKADRRLLDQFAYRYTRLQDDMGARLFPAALRALGEDIQPMPVLDRLNRLEQLGWLPSADEWTHLRRIRNEFTHDYPESPRERLDRLQLAVQSAKRLLEILAAFEQSAQRHLSN